MIDPRLIKKAEQLYKDAFIPPEQVAAMAAGVPAMDPAAAMGGVPAGPGGMPPPPGSAPPMDPAMMAAMGGGGMPMDPAMMAAMGGGGGMPMDPSMMDPSMMAPPEGDLLPPEIKEAIKDAVREAISEGKDGGKKEEGAEEGIDERIAALEDIVGQLVQQIQEMGGTPAVGGGGADPSAGGMIPQEYLTPGGVEPPINPDMIPGLAPGIPGM